MSQYLTNKVKVLVNGGSFASAITTEEVALNNYQSAKVIITSGEGDKATTSAKVVAILPDATEQEIKSQEITIGANTENEINIVANEIAHYDAINFKVVVDAVADSTVTGEIVVVLGEARYNED